MSIVFTTHKVQLSITFFRYLQACRERDMTVSVREGVDTLLMYLYRALNYVEDMERLASSENSCVVVWITFHFFFTPLLLFWTNCVTSRFTLVQFCNLAT